MQAALARFLRKAAVHVPGAFVEVLQSGLVGDAEAADGNIAQILPDKVPLRT